MEPDNLAPYLGAMDKLIDFFNRFDRELQRTRGIVVPESFVMWFQQEHLKIYAELALFASPEVLHLWDTVKAYLMGCIQEMNQTEFGTCKTMWDGYQKLLKDIIGRIRLDVGIAMRYPPSQGSKN